MNRPRRRRGRMGGAMCVASLLLSACATAPGVPPPDPVAATAYEIGPADILDVIVWREEELSGRVEVRPDGKITVALIGDVQAAGRTPEALATDIRERLVRYVDSPNVVVRVATFGSRKFFVVGSVHAPGTYDLRPDQTLVQALAVAGGFTDFADRDGVRIMRPGVGPIQPDYDSILRGETPDVPLRPNDTIIVP